jgi:tocopherol cyclase
VSAAIDLAARDAAPRWAQSLPYPLRRIWDPALYQGGRRRDAYFEGWYVKCVDAGERHPLAVILGVSHDAAGATSHSFVQLVRSAGRTAYATYPADAFTWARDDFSVAVGPNRLTRHGITLDVHAEDARIAGAIEFGPWTPWPVTFGTPGIMGWYRFVPRMECYHGVLSLDHALAGAVTLDGERLSFEGGRGYVEKDWGRSFPSSWIWAQSNHFDRAGVSATVSVARIPWLGSAFVGFIAGVKLDDQLFRFTTYTGARLESFRSGRDHASLCCSDADHVLEADLEGAMPAALKAPRHGRMLARADESLGGRLRIALRRKDGATLFTGTGRIAGVEVMDERGELARGAAAPGRKQAVAPRHDEPVRGAAARGASIGA